MLKQRTPALPFADASGRKRAKSRGSASSHSCHASPLPGRAGLLQQANDPFITDTPTGVVPDQLAGLDLRHRQHARVENRTRQAKATGLRNLPCHDYASNSAWLETVMTATDLVTLCNLARHTTSCRGLSCGAP